MNALRDDNQTTTPQGSAAINVVGDPDFIMFEADGGLTAEAQAYLGEIDADGGFV